MEVRRDSDLARAPVEEERGGARTCGAETPTDADSGPTDANASPDLRRAARPPPFVVVAAEPQIRYRVLFFVESSNIQLEQTTKILVDYPRHSGALGPNLGARPKLGAHRSSSRPSANDPHTRPETILSLGPEAAREGIDSAL